MTALAPPGPLADPVARAREHRSWYFYDWANSAFVTTTATVLFNPYLTAIAKNAVGCDEDETCTRTLSVVGIPVAAGSIALYTITFATLLSALLLPVVGAIADRTSRKRHMLAGFAWTGALAASAMFLVTGSNWQLGVGLLVIASICLGSSLVVYDAVLVEISHENDRDRLSSRGWAFGYLGGGLLLAVNLVIVTVQPFGLSQGDAVRVSLLSAGLWWGLWTIIPFRGLRDRPPVAVVQVADEEDVRTRPSVARQAFTQLRDTLRHARGYPQTLLFLAAYLLYNDGVQTVIYASSIYGQEQLGLSEDTLILAILLVQFVAFGGALLFGRVAERIGSKRAILGSLVLWTAVVAGGFFLPAREIAPFLTLAVGIGIVLGGSQALSRSLYSLLIPRGREAEYFSLYQAAERGTSWFGTLAFGLAFQLLGTYRSAILVLILFFVAGFVLLLKVDVRGGIVAAGNEVPQSLRPRAAS